MAVRNGVIILRAPRVFETPAATDTASGMCDSACPFG
jgi:hypothetical protein